MQSVNAPVWISIPGPGMCKVDIICVEPHWGVTLPCREHWQLLVTQLLGGALIEFQLIKKSACFHDWAKVKTRCILVTLMKMAPSQAFPIVI